VTEPGAAPVEVADFVTSAKAVDQQLTEDKSFGENISAIIAKRLEPELTPDSMTSIGQGLAEFTTTDIANFILQGLAYDEFDASFEADVRATFSDRLVGWMHLLRAMFGDRINRASSMFQQSPDDWMFFGREVLHDELRQTYMVRMTFTKYNGDVFVIAGPPNSPVNLTRELLVLIQSFPGKDAFGAAEFDLMSKEVLAFQERFGKAGGDQADATSAGGVPTTESSPAGAAT
jgi:hypothetical protein